MRPTIAISDQDVERRSRTLRALGAPLAAHGLRVRLVRRIALRLGQAWTASEERGVELDVYGQRGQLAIVTVSLGDGSSWFAITRRRAGWEVSRVPVAEPQSVAVRLVDWAADGTR
ncbi:hypothetical protein [Herbidospora sp. RD11066]